jgi:serine/threonine-protein kinase
MGRVWRAHDILLNRPVAVKVLRSEFTGDPAFLSRFRAEAQHAALLIHPHIASVFDYGELDEDGEHLAYLVMELVEGESLAALLARDRRLDVAHTLGILRATAAALGAAHAAGVVHRDVKPGNVLMGRGGVVKITDFGIAWSASSVPLTQTGQVIGTAHYLSPEQAQGAKATAASDVYALGAVAYECLAGRRPFEGENSVQIAVMQIRDVPDPLPADVPADVRALVERAMAKNPADRFQNGTELLDAIDRIPPHTVPVDRTAVVGLAMSRPPAPGLTRTAVLPLPPTGAGRDPAVPPPGAGRRFLVRALVGALAVIALIAVAVVLLSRGGSAPTAGGSGRSTGATTSPPASASTTPGVPLAAADYIGKPVAEVQAALVARGLKVTLTKVTTTARPAGQVTAVAPVGVVPQGATVTVSYAVAPVAVAPAPQAPAGNAGNGNGNGNAGKPKGKPKDKKNGDD